jgi:hypothetical protein
MNGRLDRSPTARISRYMSRMKTKHATGLMAVVLVFIVGAIPGLAQEDVSPPVLPTSEGTFLLYIRAYWGE